MKVLVCGTHYGSTYIRALTQFPQDSFTCVGVLSKGSEHSQQIAQQLGVPYYTDVATVPADSIDIACVAISGDAGQAIVLSLLKQGISVLCEHPVGQAFVQKALALAEQHQAYFHVNGHFADLYAPQAFLQSILSAYQQGFSCMHYAMGANLRTLYSALDLLGRALGGFTGLEVIKYSGEPMAFQPVMLKTDNLTISLLCQNFSSAEDDGSATFLNHQCSALFPHGTLTLSETTGPLSWFPSSQSLPGETWRTYMPVELAPMDKQQLMGHRDQCNLAAIAALAATIQGETQPLYQQPDYLLALSGLWQAVLMELQPQAKDDCAA
ncbi:siderophore-like synthase [Pseudoalteromonas rubra]|uniref:Siderophore-like synthase n=1 Tax=Pseudoalteromonas rubra TaxID=43658 RepID=A0A5S3WLX9_9GAMM|nr:Gfo/Idh/MocA family oxidoreductase [Pseudoalteromonas rubra]TMP28593.1 siderophore-like synthase [Pseudoalteromonas rubra]TMP28864.1 siderophore-like synthase [Pseudoalteromonas rubra]